MSTDQKSEGAGLTGSAGSLAVSLWPRPFPLLPRLSVFFSRSCTFAVPVDRQVQTMPDIPRQYYTIDMYVSAVFILLLDT